jgi:hypothetical protein
MDQLFQKLPVKTPMGQAESTREAGKKELSVLMSFRA